MDTDFAVAVAGAGAGVGAGVGIVVGVRCGDGESAGSFDHGLPGIDDEIEEYLLEIACVGAGGQVFGDFDVEGDVIFFEIASEALDGIHDEWADRRFDESHLIVRHHAEDFLAECGHARGVLMRFLGGGSQQVWVVCFEGVLAVADDGRQQVVEFVGQHGGDGAQRGEPLELFDLFLECAEAAFEDVEVPFEVVFLLGQVDVVGGFVEHVVRLDSVKVSKGSNGLIGRRVP